jgi:sterol desaturase/sphingolipid hydroxylase (fatty acid hydroxylase superfamily)
VGSQHLTHTNLRLPFEKQLEWFLVTPRMHFIHHNHQKQYGDSNFGSYFSVWDHLFGTYTDPSTVPDKDRLGLDADYTMGSLILGLRLKEVTQKVDA